MSEKALLEILYKSDLEFEELAAESKIQRKKLWMLIKKMLRDKKIEKKGFPTKYFLSAGQRKELERQDLSCLLESPCKCN